MSALLPRELLDLLALLPPEALPSLGKAVGHLLGGDEDAAQRELRVTAETVAAKRAVHEAYLQGKKLAPGV